MRSKVSKPDRQSHAIRSRDRGLQPGWDRQDLAAKLGHIGSVFHLALCDARKSKPEASDSSGNLYQSRQSTEKTKVSAPIQHNLGSEDPEYQELDL